MIRDWREAGQQPHKAPDTGEVFVCQTGQLYQRERRGLSQSHCAPISPSLSVSLCPDTKYVSGQLQLVRASAPAVTVCISVISPLSTASFHLSCPLLWQGGFCFRSSGGLSVYKDTTLTSTAFCPASNITLSLTDRISFPLQLYFCYLQPSS